MTFLSGTILLFIVLDPFGNLPFFLSVLETVAPEKRLRIVVRELFIALLVLIVFLFAGPYFLAALHISEPALRIAGGVILFLIAVKMIFGGIEEMVQGAPAGDPLLVPLAVPAVAGPSALATILLLVGQEPDRWLQWLLALFLAWLGTAVILLFAAQFSRLLGQRGLFAVQRLMGLVLTMVSVEMLLQGIKTIF